MKKRGAVKPRKKETAMATKKGTKGNTRATMPTSSPNAPREVVGEGGLPAGKGQREEPAGSSADQATPAAGTTAKEGAWAGAREAAGAAVANLPMSVAPHQGVCPCMHLELVYIDYVWIAICIEGHLREDDPQRCSAVAPERFLCSIAELASGLGASMASVHVVHSFNPFYAIL